jgi:hypothetical protein
VCERHNKSTNIITLPLKAPVKGTGWGCVVCEAPFDGAMAVVCHGCVDLEPRYVVNGKVGESKQRIPIAQVTEPFDQGLQQA